MRTLLLALVGLFMLEPNELMADEDTPKSEVTLKAIRLARLGDPVDALVKEYGKATESKESEEYVGVTTYTFRPKEKIKVVASVWKNGVHSVTYWHEAEKSDADGELLFVAMGYSGGKAWTELNPGYLYQSPDDKLRIWCSAIPAIRVETVEFASNRVALKKQETAGEQASTGQPAARPESKSEGGDKPQPEAEGRSR